MVCRSYRVAERGFFMKFKKNMMPVLLALALLFILGGIILLAFLVPGAGSTFYKVCIAIVAVLCLLIGLGVLYLLYLSRDNDPNFFLYDTKNRCNIPAEELSFDRVNSRMTYFMKGLTSSLEKLWNENLLASDSDRFGVGGVYKPLAAYKMLYDLVELDRPEGWRMFLCAPPAVIDTLTDVLASNGDEAMGKTLRQAYRNAASVDDIAWLRDFVIGNAKYIRRRMMGYVQKNLDWFY